jgi:hypothetical protein
MWRFSSRYLYETVLNGFGFEHTKTADAFDFLLNGDHCTDSARHSSATSECVKPSLHACALVQQVRKTNFHDLQNISCVQGLYDSKLVTD